VLAGLDRADDRMSLLRRVATRVPVGRGVAAADPPARLAHPKVQPAAARSKALLTARDLLRRVGDENLVEVGAGGDGATLSGEPASFQARWGAPGGTVTGPPTASARTRPPTASRSVPARSSWRSLWSGCRCSAATGPVGRNRIVATTARPSVLAAVSWNTTRSP